MEHLCHTLPSQGPGNIEEEKQERLGSGGGEWLQGNCVFWRKQDRCTFGFTLVVTTSTRPAHIQARQIISMDSGVGILSPMLLAICSLLGDGKSVLFKDVGHGRLIMLQ